ncbi:hypothetical protein [Novosphingopyxis baekryungensis]|uniref:hypothetical protein n=1 Tax=Novosphingopyxis baekryungensis TaxID=279369 RepID=UPI0003B58B7B|nr:hypothetical protein [Novosphingopyxis baekryungensis]
MFAPVAGRCLRTARRVILPLVLLLQTASANIPAAPPAERSELAQMESFDLTNLHSSPPPEDEDIIIVRADQAKYRVNQTLDLRFEEDGKAEFGLPGGARGAVEAEAIEIAPGIQSNRLMFRVKTPF